MMAMSQELAAAGDSRAEIVDGLIEGDDFLVIANLIDEFPDVCICQNPSYEVISCDRHVGRVAGLYIPVDGQHVRAIHWYPCHFPSTLALLGWQRWATLKK